MAEVVPKAGGKAEAKVVDADAEVEDAGAAAVGVAAGKVMAKADADDVVAAVVVVADSVKAAVPISNRSKTATFRANQGKGCSNFIRTDTASCGAPRTIIPVSGAIPLFPER